MRQPVIATKHVLFVAAENGALPGTGRRRSSCRLRGPLTTQQIIEARLACLLQPASIAAARRLRIGAGPCTATAPFLLRTRRVTRLPGVAGLRGFPAGARGLRLLVPV